MIFKKILKDTVTFLSCMLLACSLVSCKGVEITGNTEDVESYTKAQCMIIVASERNRLQNILGQKIWNLPVYDKREETYGQYYIDKTREFLQDIKTLNVMALKSGAMVSSQDMEIINNISSEFYDALTDQDKAFMGDCTIEDVQSMYREYYIACKTAQYLISDANLEIPDSDVKVIRVQVITVSDELQAEKLLQAVNVEGANFAYYARQNSEDTEIEKTISKIDAEDAVHNAAFALEENQISDVIEQDGRYYIIKCIDSYDEDATMKRKETLEKALKSEAFFKEYNSYSDEHIVRFRDAFWQDIDLTQYSDSKADNFFQLFEDNISID